MGVDWEERVDFARLRKERLARASKAIDEAGLGMLLCYNINSVRYITGYHYGEWGRDKNIFYTMLPKGSDHPVFCQSGSRSFVTRQDAPWLTKDMRPSMMYSFSMGAFGNVQPAVDNFVEQIKTVRKDYGVADLPIGIDIMPDMYLNKTLQANHIQVEDGWKPILLARSIKTKDEIELMKIAASMTDGMYDALGRAIRPGVKENELVGIANHTLYSLGSDDAVALNACSGPRTNPNHHDGSDRILRPGDIIFFDTFASYVGYRTCYYRSFSVGRSTKAQRESYRISHDMMYDAIKKVKPGVTTTEVASVWPEPAFWGRKNMQEAGDNAVGHGIGMSIHEPPRIQRGVEPIKLQKNMVIALETWYGPTGGDHGIRLEEECVVTDTGCEVITKFSNHTLPECMGGWYEHSNE
jgi:Xaa-Pro aminopeptidase